MDGKSFIVPHGCANARAFLCTPLGDDTATRSTVLSTFMDCEGVVELPCGLGMSELRAWEELPPEQAPELSSGELFEALKVFV